MKKRVGAAIAVCAVGVGLSIPAGAGAAPITCKGNQTVEKAPGGGGFVCVNNGGGTPGGAVETKNPND